MANTVLGTPQGVPSSTDFMGGFKPPKNTSEAIQKEGEIISELARATTAEGEAAGQAGVRKAELQAPILKQEAQTQKSALGEFKSAAEGMQDLEFKPTQESLMSLTGIASMTAVIGLMLGKTGGFSGQSAIDSMTGMMKGYQQGKADIFKQEQAVFEKNVQAQKANLEKLKTKLDTAMKMAATDRQGAEANIAVMLAEIDSDFLKAKYNKEGLKGLLDSVSKLEGAMAKRDELAQKAKIAGGKVLGKDILPEIQGVRGINSLMRQLDDPDVRTGLTAKFAPWKEKLASLAGKKDQDFESAVNSSLTGTDKTTLFLKDALLETYAIERAAKGGQRLTVQDMKMVGPVLDPTNYKPETYKALLDSRRRSLYNSLQDKGMSVQEINTRAQEHQYEPYSGEKSKESAGNQDIDVLRSQAKARIAAGGDEEAVKKRFKDITGKDL